MRIAAVLVTAWVAWRCIGLAAGLVRLRRLEGPTRREARRTVIGHAAITAFLMVVTFYAWAVATDLQPTDTLVGFLAAVLMISLVIGIAARLMQPPARLPHSVGLCRVFYPSPETRVGPRGTVTASDASGAYVSTVAPGIEAPWDAPVRRCVELVTSRLGQAVHSIYVRGSIATATAVEQEADLDVIVVADRIPSGDWASEVDDAIRTSHPFVRRLDLLVVEREEVDRDDARNPMAFRIATQSLCVHGQDLTERLPAFGFGPWAFLEAPSLLDVIERATAEMPHEGDADRRDTCSWVMRRILRAGFEAVMADEPFYTRDLYPCYEAFRRHHPQHADQMWRVLELAVEPTDDADVVTELCSSLGVWVAQRANEVYRLTVEASREDP